MTPRRRQNRLAKKGPAARRNPALAIDLQSLASSVSEPPSVTPSASIESASDGLPPITPTNASDSGAPPILAQRGPNGAYQNQNHYQHPPPHYAPEMSLARSLELEGSSIGHVSHDENVNVSPAAAPFHLLTDDGDAQSLRIPTASCHRSQSSMDSSLSAADSLLRHVPGKSPHNEFFSNQEHDPAYEQNQQEYGHDYQEYEHQQDHQDKQNTPTQGPPSDHTYEEKNDGIESDFIKSLASSSNNHSENVYPEVDRKLHPHEQHIYQEPAVPTEASPQARPDFLAQDEDQVTEEQEAHEAHEEHDENYENGEHRGFQDYENYGGSETHADFEGHESFESQGDYEGHENFETQGDYDDHDTQGDYEGNKDYQNHDDHGSQEIFNEEPHHEARDYHENNSDYEAGNDQENHWQHEDYEHHPEQREHEGAQTESHSQEQYNGDTSTNEPLPWESESNVPAPEDGASDGLGISSEPHEEPAVSVEQSAEAPSESSFWEQLRDDNAEPVADTARESNTQHEKDNEDGNTVKPAEESNDLDLLLDDELLDDELLEEKEENNDSAKLSAENDHEECEQQASNAPEVESQHEQLPEQQEDQAQEEHQELQQTSSHKRLELLDLDDDLLDDDFLDDGPEAPEPTPEPPAQVQRLLEPFTDPPRYAPTSHRPTPVKPVKLYVPSATQPQLHTHQQPPPQINHQEKVKKELDQAKKKNDAYDFPMNFVKPPARVAPRHAARAGGSSSVSSIPPILRATSTSSHSSSPMVASTNIPPVAPRKSSTEASKPFFEEPQINLPTSKARPARAQSGAANPSMAGLQSNPIGGSLTSPTHPVGLPAKSPKNPYAQLQPKMQSAQASHVQPPHPQFPNNAMLGKPQMQPVPGLPQPAGPLHGFATGNHAPGMPSVPAPLFPGQHGTPFNAPQPGIAPPAPQPFPAVAPPTGSDGETQHPPKPSRGTINTAVKTTDKGSGTSPYVPRAGPYAPSARGHSRTSSLMGARGKEVNPYAPIQGPNVGQAQAPNQLSAAPVGQVAPQGYANINSRSRGASINRDLQRPQGRKIQNPTALSQRQFPIFHWSNSQNVTCLIPSKPFSSFDRAQRVVKVTQLKDLTKIAAHQDFPGPLVKGKSKKKDIEAWLQKRIGELEANNPGSEEVLLAHILLVLLRNDGDFRSPAVTAQVAAVLTPNIDYLENSSEAAVTAGGKAISANAYRLDNQGINSVWSLMQVGNTEAALNLALSKGDWALGFILAYSISSERFAKVASDYARITFPFQKNQSSKVQHMMPLLMKIAVGNVSSVINDLVNVSSEGEYARTHYRELIAASIVNNSNTEILIELGKFLESTGKTTASEICFVLAGLIMTPTPLTNGAVFSFVGSAITTSVYAEVYEHILQISPMMKTAAGVSGFPHLLRSKLKRAQLLADAGYFSESRRYCDYIGSTIKTLGKSSFVGPQLIQEFQTLLVRLSESGSSESGWLGAKLSRVNLDKVWGQLDKFIGGEEAPNKGLESGVFSKFSPSVSRNSSALDISQIPYKNTERPGYPRSMSAASMPSGIGGAAPVVQPPSVRAGAPLKYAPQSHAADSRPQTGPGLLSAPVIPKQSRYSPNHLSQPNMNTVEQSPRSDDVKQPPRAPFSRAQNGRNVYGNNRAGNISSLSVSSHVSTTPLANEIHKPMSELLDLSNLDDTHHKPAVGSSPRGLNRTHLRATSMQSDVDGIPEENSADRLLSENGDDTSKAKEDTEGTNLEQSKDETVKVEQKEQDEKKPEEVKQDEEKDGETEKANLAPPPPPPPAAVPKKSTPPVRNPYAPGASRANTRASSRYSQAGRTANKYAVPSDSKPKSFNAGTPSNVEYGDIFGAKPDQKDETSDRGLSHETLKQDPRPGSIVLQDKKSDAPSTVAPPVGAPPIVATPAGAPRVSASNANIDDSFDNDDTNESEEVEESKPPGFSGGQVGGKADFANPFQNDKSPLHLGGGLDDFPIPGSPEATTRANSVIGHNGLFSSKLSQSQQSMLYQQYEVKDDTVKDYVPVPEEEEEDDEEAEKKKKEAAEKKAAEKAAEKTAKKQSQGSGSEGSGWFGRWRGNTKDDKPKPIKAKLGTTNTFKYDEKLKRWIDTSRPLDEQLQAAAPPPPPERKKAPAKPPAPGPAPGPAGPISAPAGPARGPGGGKTPGTEGPSGSGPAPPRGGPRAPPRANLANASLDDLLSLGAGGGASTGGTGGRKSKRRYVNVLESKTLGS